MIDRALIEAASWRIAAEVCRHLPHLTIIETHPGGGQYDCLTLATSDFKAVADLNRAGSVCVHAAGEVLNVWPTLLEPNSVRQWVKRIAALLGADPEAKLPPTAPRVLTYRVIASAVGAPFAESRWECRNGACDTSGDPGSGVRKEFFAFPGASAHAQFPQNTAEALRLAYHYWFICRDDEPVAALYDGGMGWTFSGVRMPLWDMYQADRRIGPLVSQLLGNAME